MNDPHEPRPTTQESGGEARVATGGTVREILYKQPGSREQTPATEATEAELGEINASTVLMERSGSEQITAERVSMERSGAKSIETKSAQLDRSGVVALGSDNAVLLRSSAVQVVAEEVRMSHSSAVFVMSERATLEDSRVVIFAGQADGDVQAVMTTRSAAIFGAAAGLVLTLMMVILGARSGKQE